MATVISKMTPEDEVNAKVINGVKVQISPKHKNRVSELVESKSGGLLILGGGKTVWEDYFGAKEILPSYEIMCVNDIACQFKAERIHHAVSLHRGILPAVRLMRREKSMLEDIITHCHKAGPQIDVVWTIDGNGGTSGAFAVRIALIMGYTKIVLCGIPMDNSGHYFDPTTPTENNTTNFQVSSTIAQWTDFGNNKFAKDRVRSMSGRTSSIFGKPTKEWSNGSN